MKRSAILFPLFLMMVLITSCARENTLPMGRYVLQDAPVNGWAWVEIREGGTFTFNRSLATSYRPEGSFKVDGNRLLLVAGEEEIYEFTIQGDELIFHSGRFAEDLIEPGAAFEFEGSPG